MTLTQIAFLMRREARQSGKAQRTLKRGLTLTLQRQGNHWTLSLTRPEVPPSEREVTICRARFEVPASAAEETDQVGEYHVTRLKWTEVYTQTSFAEEPVARYE